MRTRSLCLSSLAAIAFLAACGSASDDAPEVSAESHLEQHPLEKVPAGEAEAIGKITAAIAKSVRDDFASQPAEGRVARRDAHAKHHGCVKANVAIDGDLPADLKSTVFVPGRTYPAWIRFSNGAGKPAPDQDGDGRGMAIKLVGVPGDKILEGDEKKAVTQDFLMINHPQFFVRNAADYVEFQDAVMSGGSPIKFFFPSLNPFTFRLHELGVANAIRAKKVASPLQAQYFSMAPYAFGKRAVKWSARPCGGAPDAPFTLPSSPNYLREAMASELANGSACFELLVQEQTDPTTMPVEDPTIEWTSPFRKLATITIPQQDFASKARMDMCENMSFTPWHSVPEHQPLGGINRARRVVYETISTVRHELNKAPRTEPTDMSVPGEP